MQYPQFVAWNVLTVVFFSYVCFLDFVVFLLYVLMLILMLLAAVINLSLPFFYIFLESLNCCIYTILNAG